MTRRCDVTLRNPSVVPGILLTVTPRPGRLRPSLSPPSLPPPLRPPLPPLRLLPTPPPLSPLLHCRSWRGKKKKYQNTITRYDGTRQRGKYEGEKKKKVSKHDEHGRTGQDKKGKYEGRKTTKYQNIIIREDETRERERDGNMRERRDKRGWIRPWMDKDRYIRTFNGLTKLHTNVSRRLSTPIATSKTNTHNWQKKWPSVR